MNREEQDRVLRAIETFAKEKKITISDFCLIALNDKAYYSRKSRFGGISAKRTICKIYECMDNWGGYKVQVNYTGTKLNTVSFTKDKTEAESIKREMEDKGIGEVVITSLS